MPKSSSASRRHHLWKTLMAGEICFERSPPLRSRDGEELPLPGHTLEDMRTALLEFEA